MELHMLYENLSQSFLILEKLFPSSLESEQEISPAFREANKIK